jgi:TRAP-type C4-dicarboxylate transport system substrate-binding protein
MKTTSIGLTGFAALLLVACGGTSADAPAAKAGAEPSTITVSVEDPGAPSPAYAALGIFATEVEKLSQGAITVELIAGPEDVSEESIAADVIDGTYDLGLIRTGAWSGAGVTSMRALQAPFLIESDAHVVAITRDTDLVDRLFAGLGPAGIHGLVLWPDELRHFFSFTDPIRTTADVEGRTIRVLTQETEEMMKALGSTPVSPPYNDYSIGVADGTITATDSGFLSAGYSLPAPATATANVILYPKVISLVVNGELWNGLTETQRTILTQAAETTRDRVIADHPSDTESAQGYCAGGGAVVLADAEAIEGFRAAVAPIYASIEQDADAAEVLVEIRALATRSDRALVACDGRPDPVDPNDVASIQPSAGGLPNGMYRYEVTADDVVAAGLPEYEVGPNAGVYTWTLKDGHWSVDYPYQIPSEPGGFFVADEGVYEVHGELLYMAITFFEEHYRPPYVLTLRWAQRDDGSLVMKYVDGVDFMRLFDVADYTSEPWVRIADR